MTRTPETLLACRVGPYHFCLREFKTVNGGQTPAKPFHLQEYSNGQWATFLSFSDPEVATDFYEVAIADHEKTHGPRGIPQFDSWTALYLPEPDHGFCTHAAELQKELAVAA
ncbi:MAG: hypothetical protein COA78_14360 [Blastopirellula sp.]|nr:MAG: hypothetical protein COA78_14360 [Blastopirellula sp.]